MLQESDPAPPLDLPPELHQYGGDPEDTKALAKFQRQQAAMMSKLQKARSAWEVRIGGKGSEQ